MGGGYSPGPGQGGRGTPARFLERGRGCPPLMLRDRDKTPLPETASITGSSDEDSMRSATYVHAAKGGWVPLPGQDRGVGGPPLLFWRGGWGTPSHVEDRSLPPLPARAGYLAFQTCAPGETKVTRMAAWGGGSLSWSGQGGGVPLMIREGSTRDPPPCRCITVSAVPFYSAINAHFCTARGGVP